MVKQAKKTLTGGSDTKSLHESRTARFNFIALIVIPMLVALGGILQGIDFAEYLSPTGVLVATSCVGAFNIYLRKITTQPIK